MTLDTQFTRSAHVNRSGKNKAQNFDVLCPLLNSRNGLSFENCELLYKQVIRFMSRDLCPIWGSAASSHIRNLEVLQSKCLRIANNAP
jgi:hypothetical protein